jgi:hypothetical protein
MEEITITVEQEERKTIINLTWDGDCLRSEVDFGEGMRNGDTSIFARVNVILLNALTD